MSNPAPITIGRQLAAARQAKGWTLEEAARRTHLKPALLACLEADEFDRLPSVTNARGFIRLYARELELDGWSLLKQFNGAAAAPVDLLELAPEDLEAIPTRSREPVATSQGIGLALTVVVILAAIGVGVYKLYTIRSFINQPPPLVEAATAAPPPEPAASVSANQPQERIPVAKPVDQAPVKPVAVNQPAAPAPAPAADRDRQPPKARPVEAAAAPPAAPATPPAATKGLRLQLVADTDADESSRWVRVVAIRNGKEERVYADILPPGKTFPPDEPWVADAFVVSMREAAVIGIVQNGGAPQKYELPGIQRVKLPAN
ncbi:MAG: helix-turn-helix domain-containing protein [Verrucomicrobiales bacterium]|jgi:cytoskeleton protein RodZ|nr:helix-turn-helix domain-containing protein [Verrucomicrobiales bacterium]